MKTLKFALFALLPFAYTLPAHAQGGCVNSPECPTLALAAVGALGALVRRSRVRSSRTPRPTR